MPPPLPPTIPSVPNAIQLGAQPPHNPVPMVGNDAANNQLNANQGDAAAAADAATAAALAAAMAVTNERASSIPVDSFRSGVDDLDEWFEIFENAVKLAMNPSSDDRKWQLCKSWLPIKLDSEARAVYKQIPSTLTYEQTKAQLKDRLVDPNEVYKWKAMKTQIVWDGKESFQALATRVKRAVDNYEKELDDNGKKWAYFFRFRESLPETPYQDYIDLSLTKQDRTIENAMELASRVKMTQRDKEPAKEPKQVAFTGLAMADDRIGGLELAIAQLGTEVRNMSVQGKPSDDRGRSTSDGYTRYSRTATATAQEAPAETVNTTGIATATAVTKAMVATEITAAIKSLVESQASAVTETIVVKPHAVTKIPIVIAIPVVIEMSKIGAAGTTVGTTTMVVNATIVTPAEEGPQPQGLLAMTATTVVAITIAIATKVATGIVVTAITMPSKPPMNTAMTAKMMPPWMPACSHFSKRRSLDWPAKVGIRKTSSRLCQGAHRDRNCKTRPLPQLSRFSKTP